MPVPRRARAPAVCRGGVAAFYPELDHQHSHVRLRFGRLGLCPGGYAQLAEARLQTPLVHVYRHAQVPIEIPIARDLPVRLVERVGEVGEDDEGLDAAAVAVVAGGAWGGFGVTGAVGEGVEEGLEVPCEELRLSGQFCGPSLIDLRGKGCSRLGGRTSPAGRGEGWSFWRRFGKMLVRRGMSFF